MVSKRDDYFMHASDWAKSPNAIKNCLEVRQTLGTFIHIITGCYELRCICKDQRGGISTDKILENIILSIGCILQAWVWENQGYQESADNCCNRLLLDLFKEELPANLRTTESCHRIFNAGNAGKIIAFTWGLYLLLYSWNILQSGCSSATIAV